MKNDFLREQKSVKFVGEKLTDEFREFVKSDLLPELKVIKGYKQKEKANAAADIVANLILAANRNMAVSESRDFHVKGVRLRLPIWDALIEHKLAICCVGSESSGKVTRYGATDKLLHRLSEWHLRQVLDTELKRNSQLVIPIEDALVVIRPLRKDRKSRDEVLPIPEAESEFVEHVENQLDFINRSNLRHSWQVFVTDQRGKERVEQPNIMLQQKHAGKFFDWVRIYTAGRWGAQGLGKATREKMLIDGEPVAELDFSCSVLRLLYHLMKVDPEQHTDLYRPDVILPLAYRKRPEETRKLVKRATTIMTNASGPVQAAKAIRAKIKESESLQGVLRLNRISERKLVQRIQEEHTVPFYTPAAPILMTVESTIMLRICTAFALQGSLVQRRELTEEEQMELLGELRPDVFAATPFGKPLLPIHDAVVVKQSDADFAKQTMIDEYKAVMDFEPVVHREF